MYVFIISLCIVAAAFVVQRFANKIDEQLNACGTGTFKDGLCECLHPYTGTHCEIVDCGYGKLVDSVFAYDTITTPKGPSGCECEAQYWGYNCANCTSKFSAQCTGPCKDRYFGARCDIMCKSGTENDEQGVLHREAGGTYNYFVESHGFCLNYGDVKGTVKCREGRAGAHCELQCPLCVYGSCNLDDGTCDCFDGYFGNLCEGTCPNRCSGLNGVCQEDGTCKCYDGFTGDDCSLECCVEGRGTELSSVHGTCLEDIGGCNCSKEIVPVDLPDELYSVTPFHGVGWEGSQCDCHENITCGGRGRCVEGGCECTANFQGARCDICNDSKVGPFCQYDRWQCPDRENANGEFVAKNNRGDYGCKCNSGFTGDTCEECIASAYPKTGDNMCTIIVPESLCHAGSVNPDYDKTNDMCICDTNFDTQTDCASCHDHWYGPDCDYYCRESTATGAVDCGSTGGVCSNSGPGCICPKGTTFSGTPAGGGICVTCGGDAGCKNGTCIEGRCRCDPNYYGDNCNITAPKSGDKVCSGYSSVIIETAATCDLTADCLDESENAPVANQIEAHKARIYDRRDQMFCHRDDTPKGLKNIQGCCVDKNGDGFCDKDKLESVDSCTFINAAGNPEEGEVVNDICNNRVLEDETNVFEWCLSKNRSCTANGACEDPELCENRCDAGLGPAEWIKIWEWEHSRTMTDVMSESWKFASDFPDPYEYRKSYTYQNPCPSTHPYLEKYSTTDLYWCYVDLPSGDPCNMYNSGIPPPEGGTWGSNQPACVPNCKSFSVSMAERVCDESEGDITKSDYKGQFTLGQCADACLEADGFIWKSSSAGCYCTTGTIDDCVSKPNYWSQYKFEKDANCYQKPVPALDANIDDVCVAGEMYDVCRDYLIPDDANVFNMTHKFTDKWETMPNYQDCTLKKVISVNVDGKVVIPIDEIYAGVLETTEDNTAVFGRYQNGEAAYTGNVNHNIDSITVFGKGFTGANKLTILIYDYESDTCSDFVRKVGSHYDLCSQIKFHELDYDWGAFCKWRPTSLATTYEYSTFSSGTCASNGYEGIADIMDCNEAAKQLGYNTASWSTTKPYLSGAFSNADKATCFATHYGVIFNYNNAGTSTLQCTAVDNCVCRRVLPSSFDDRCYRQSTVCTAGCDNYQEGCEGLPLLSEHPTPMPAPCNRSWDGFCENYMDFEHKEEGVCAYTECICEGYGVGGPACDMQCPVPTGVDTELSCGSDLNMGKCIKDRGVIAFGVEQGKCDCYNGGNPAEGCTATCEEGTQDCSSQIDTPFSFEYSNCSALSNIDESKTIVDLNGSYTCHVFLPDSACNFFRGRCECATPFTAYTEEEKPIYLNPHSSYRIALMQGYDIDEYLAFTTYNGTVPDRDREAFDDFDPNFKCFKDLEHTVEVSCDWIRALKHFARGGSYRIGDCTNLAPGTDIEYQEPCSGHGFPQGGTCACDYAEEFETRSSGVGLSFEQPGLTETPWRGKACQFVCPGYDMKTMSSVCSGHGRCETDGRCACDQGWTGYKCDLQCEAEQKPLTCSGHGVCDERSIVLRGDIVTQLDASRCDDLPECNAENYASGPCTNETMTLARDRVIKSGDLIYHMYYDEANKITTYGSALASSIEFLSFETSGLTVRNADTVSLNPDINVCSDFTLKKTYKEVATIGGPVILSMIDSYGDGWNGFQLSVGGTTYGSTFEDGTSQTQQISGLDETIEVSKVANGNYPGEVSFEIRCEQGNDLLLSGGGFGGSWNFENTCPKVLTDAIVIEKDSTVVATLTEIGEFSVTGAEINDVYTYSDIVSSIGGSLTVVACDSITRNAVLDDFSIEGTAVRHDYDFGSNIPFMPCQDRMNISREHPAHPLLPEMASVDLECNMFAQKQVTENGADYFKSYRIMCGVCDCEEKSQTGNWTGYDCRTPALGFYRSNARSQCPGMTADMNPCNGGGTCRWGSTDGLGTQIRDSASKCYCGDVTDEATLETAPRSEYGILVHASSHGTPLFYDEIDTFEKVSGLLEYNDIQPSAAICSDLIGLPYALGTMDSDYETRKRTCYDACANVDGANKIVEDSDALSYLTFWDDISHAKAFLVSSEVPEDSVILTMTDSYGDGWNEYTLYIDGTSYTFDSGYGSTATLTGLSGTVSVTQTDGRYPSEASWNIRCEGSSQEMVSGTGSGSWSFTADCPDPECWCFGNSLEGCSNIATSWNEMDAFVIFDDTCPTGTEPITHAGDCRRGLFKTDEPYSLIPSFQFCEMPDKSDQVQTLEPNTEITGADEIVFNCYMSCIDGQKSNEGGATSDPLFWSKHTKEDITHFSVVTDGSSAGTCVCYATNVDDCKDGDASVPLTSTSNTISYRINHHSHPYDLTTGSSNTIPTLSSLTTGTCQKEFAAEVFADKSYGPTITYKASSSVCDEAYELDGYTEIIPDKDTKVYSTRLAETDPLYDRDPAQECANRCHAENKGYDGFMILSYVSSGNINSCLCGNECDTPQIGHAYFKMYSMRTVPDPYKTDNTQSICHPSPLQLSNYKSDCSCKFGFTGNTCETPRMMCLWNGEETDGTECICNDNGELNPKVSKYGCCTKGTYWDQDKYASFTPLSEFEPLPANRFYQDAFLYVCKPPETLLDYETDQDRIIDIHNYVANTDEYLLTKPAVCGDAPETRLFTSTLQTLTSKSPDTFTVTRGTGDDARSIVVDKDKTILELKEGSEPKEQCAAFCVSKNKGYKGFSIFTPTPEMVKTSDKEKPSDAGTPNVWCTDDDYVRVYNGWARDNEDPNPGGQIGSGDTKHQAILDACWAGCTFRPRVSKTRQLGYANSRPQNFWDVYGPDDITYIRVSNPAVANYYGSCTCHTGDLDTCETLEEDINPPGTGTYKNHQYKVVRGDTECTCEPFIALMDDQEEFKDPMSYEDNEGWSNALPRTTERYDIQFPVDIEAEAQNLGCFENIDGRVLKIDQLSGTSHSISSVETAYVDVSSARSSVGGTFEECYEECKYDDVFTYGFTYPEIPRYNLEGKGSCISPDAPFSTSSTVLSGHDGDVNSVAWSPDGFKIVSGSNDNTVRVWDSDTGAELLKLTVNSIVWSVAWSPDGTKIVSGSNDKTVKVWNSQTGALIRTLTGHVYPLRSVAWSPDGSKIVSGSLALNAQDGPLRVWDSGTGAELMKLEGHTESVLSVSFSADGSKIVSGSDDKTTRLWDSTTGAELLKMEASTTVNSVSISPDGSRIVSGTNNNRPRVWDGQSGAELMQLWGHIGRVTSVSFSPDGSNIVSGSWDNTVRVWDTVSVSGELLTTLGEGYYNYVLSVSFSPDGSRIASGTKNNYKVHLWNRKTEGEHLESSVVSDASECYKNCRYKKGISGFVFKPGNNRCVCTTTEQKGCSTSDQSYDRYSVSDDYMEDQFTELIRDGSDGWCYGMPGIVRPYDGNGDNPGEDFAGKTRACYDACANVNGDNIVAAITSGSNQKFWENYNGYDVINWMVALNGRCYCYTDADDEENCEKTWKVLEDDYAYDVYRRNPFPEEKTCTCYSGGRDQINSKAISDVFQVSGTSVGTLMSVQKSPAVNPAPCNVNSYVALGDDIVGDTCNCPIGALEEAYIDVGFERAIVNGRCNDYTSEQRGYVNPCPSSHPNLGGPYSGNQFWCYSGTPNWFGGPCNMHNSGKPPPPGYIWGSNQADCVLSYQLLQANHRCTHYVAPTGPKSGGYALFLDPSDPLASTDRAEECSNRCSAEDYTHFYLHKGWGGRCMCGSDSCSSRTSWDQADSYTIKTYTRSTLVYGGVAKLKLSEEDCKTTCENDPHCDSYSYAPDDPNPCRTAINCAGFEYKFEGACGGSLTGIKEDRDVGVLPNIKACRDRCADYRGFLYSEKYRKCICEDNNMTGSYHSNCDPGTFVASDQYTRYQHNFEPAAAGEDATIMVKQPLTTTKGRYCATGEEELYTVSITDPRADVYACAQNATLQGMEVARGSVNGLTFTCYVYGTYYANPDDPELGIVNCGDFRTSGGPQYILQAGMQRRIGNELAATSYQNKAIKDDLFNSELYPSDTPEGCKVHCDPYKYRHFQFSNRDKTCQCIKKEKSLLTLTGDPNDMEYEIHDFSAGLIDSPHEMCFCEGFYLVDGQAQSCPAGKYSSKLTPCSAACTNCPVGQFSDTGASECGTCVAGQIQTSPTSCSKCAAGQYAKAGAIECSKCEIGKYAIGVGAGACTLCPTGKYQYPEATGTTTNTCQDCPEGWEQPNMEQTDCKECGIGKYTTSEGTAECLVCGSGKYQNENEQKSADACHSCSAGQYQNQNGQSACVNCAVGKYQSQTGKTGCQKCSAGKYQAQTGKTSCHTCSAGKFAASGWNGCGTCSPGWYSSAGSSTCSECIVGYYQPQAGKGSCITCPAAATTSYALGRFRNDISKWGTVSGYGYSFFYPNKDRMKVDSCLYVQEGDYNLQGSNSAEGFNYDKVHCRYASQNNKIDGYVPSKYVLRWCWIDRGNCRDVVNGAVFNYDLTETGRRNGGWKQCKPYHRGYRL